jgi:hypothetical protein
MNNFHSVLIRAAASAIGIFVSCTLLLGPALIAKEASAHPDLGGYWLSGGPGPGGGPPGPPRGFGRGGGGPAAGPPPFGPGRRGGPGGGSRPQPSDAGIAAASGYEQPYDDPAIQCDIANIIFGWTHDENVNEIIQTDRTITLKYGYMDFVRTVHMDMKAHPKNLTPTRGGHSIGSWDGDTLVVDTVGLQAGVLIPISGVMFSDQAHVVERFTLDAQNHTLTREYRFEDPLYLKQPYTGRDVMSASTEPYVPYDCVELSGDNNRRPVR